MSRTGLAALAARCRANGMPELAERLEAELAASGRCRICGRALSHPESVKRGIGPDCWGRQPKGEP